VRKREYLSRVREWHRSHSRRVEGAKKVHEEGNQAQVCIAVLGNVIAHASHKERPEHIGKRGKKQAAATESIDCPDCRPSEREVHETEPKRRNEGFLVCGSSFCEDRGAVERDDVDAAHLFSSASFIPIEFPLSYLLTDHHNTRSLRRATDTRNREQLNEACEEVGLGVDSSFANEDLFLLEEAMGVVEVACCLKRGVA